MNNMSSPQISPNDKINNCKVTSYIKVAIAIGFILVIHLMHQSSKRRHERLRKAIRAERVRESAHKEDENRDRNAQCMEGWDEGAGVWEGIMRIERDMLMEIAREVMIGD